MRAVYFLAGAALAMTSAWAIAQDAPESLLPKMFDEPASQRNASPRPTATPSRSAAPSANPSAASAPASTPRVVSSPVTQELPVTVEKAVVTSPKEDDSTLRRIPSLEELERMSPEDFEALLGSKILTDMPPQARRDIIQAGLLGENEGGFPLTSLSYQNPALIRVALAGNRGHVVSRWGHILLRRALVSRLAPPQGMSAQDFLALRVSLLLRMGETDAARAVLQDMDIAQYTPAIGAVVLDVYAQTGDFTGMCPVMATQGTLREDTPWGVTRTMCDAFRGNSATAISRLEKDRKRSKMEQIDMLLAQKYASAAGKSRRAITIEWDKVTSLNPWRYGLAIGVGLEPPAALMTKTGGQLDYMTALAPMASLSRRAAASDRAAARGVLSNAAVVDLYSQIYADPDMTGEWQERAESLRDAYTKEDVAARVAAMQTIWGTKTTTPYGRLVLTAVAAARVAPSEALAESAPYLLASMLSAGYDANALRWSKILEAGSRGWGMLVLAAPGRMDAVNSGAINSFVDADDSQGKRRSGLLVAGLAGLGRVDKSVAEQISNDTGAGIGGETQWTQAIQRAASRGDAASVVLLAGFGMQGQDWHRMTPRYLYHIVAALRQVGLEAEARMIAAEAIARI